MIPQTPNSNIGIIFLPKPATCFVSPTLIRYITSVPPVSYVNEKPDAIPDWFFPLFPCTLVEYILPLKCALCYPHATTTVQAADTCSLPPTTTDSSLFSLLPSLPFCNWFGHTTVRVVFPNCNPDHVTPLFISIHDFLLPHDKV